MARARDAILAVVAFVLAAELLAYALLRRASNAPAGLAHQLNAAASQAQALDADLARLRAALAQQGAAGGGGAPPPAAAAAVNAAPAVAAAPPAAVPAAAGVLPDGLSAALKLDAQGLSAIQVSGGKCLRRRRRRRRRRKEGSGIL